MKDMQLTAASTWSTSHSLLPFPNAKLPAPSSPSWRTTNHCWLIAALHNLDLLNTKHIHPLNSHHYNRSPSTTTPTTTAAPRSYSPTTTAQEDTSSSRASELLEHVLLTSLLQTSRVTLPHLWGRQLYTCWHPPGVSSIQ